MREIMNKLKTLIAASFCLTIFSFNANAEFGVGVAGQFINIDAEGNEKPSVNPNSARDTESASVWLDGGKIGLISQDIQFCQDRRRTLRSNCHCRSAGGRMDWRCRLSKNLTIQCGGRERIRKTANQGAYRGPDHVFGLRGA